MTGKYFFLHFSLEIIKNGKFIKLILKALSILSIQILSYVTNYLGDYHVDKKNDVLYGLFGMFVVLLLESYFSIKSNWYL